MRLAIVIGLAGLLGSAARADDAPPFVTIDRQDGASRAVVEATYIPLLNFAPTTLVRLDAYGQYVDPGTGLGGYAQVPVWAELIGGPTADGLGNLELGAIYTTRTGSDVRIMLHGGVALPTARDAYAGDEGPSLNTVASTGARPTDLVIGTADTTSLRVAGSVLFRSGQLFARIDVGADYLVKQPAVFDAPRTYLRLDAAIGIDTGTMAYTVESSNVYRHADTFATSTLDALGLSVRLRAIAAQPYAALTLGLDDETQRYATIAITAGVAISLL